MPIPGRRIPCCGATLSTESFEHSKQIARERVWVPRLTKRMRMGRHPFDISRGPGAAIPIIQRRPDGLTGVRIAKLRTEYPMNNNQGRLMAVPNLRVTINGFKTWLEMAARRQCCKRNAEASVFTRSDQATSRPANHHMTAFSGSITTRMHVRSRPLHHALPAMRYRLIPIIAPALRHVLLRQKTPVCDARIEFRIIPDFRTIDTATNVTGPKLIKTV